MPNYSTIYMSVLMMIAAYNKVINCSLKKNENRFCKYIPIPFEGIEIHIFVKLKESLCHRPFEVI